MGAGAAGATELPVWSSPMEGETTACELGALLARVGSRCRRVTPTRTRASHAPEQAAHASDGNLCTAWSATAHAAERVSMDLPGDVVSAVILVPEIEPPRDHPVHHLTIGNGKALETFLLTAGVTRGVPALVVLPHPRGLKTLDLRSQGRRSAVGWREVVAVACDGVAHPPQGWKVLTTPPPPTPQEEVFEPGSGACARDDQCEPARECHPRSCVTARPITGGIGSTQGCDQAYHPGQVSPRDCACRERKCGVLRYRPKTASPPTP